MSNPIQLAGATSHELAVSLGSMMPGAGDRLYLEHPSLALLREFVSIRFDGQLIVVMRMRQDKPDADSASVLTYGINKIGGSMVSARFGGQISGVRAWDYEEILNGGWRNYPGPIRLLLRFPNVASGQAEPLLTTGQNGAGDVLYVKYLDEGHVQFGLDHWNYGGPMSEIIANEPGQQHEVVMSFDPVLPPPEKGGMDAFQELRRRCVIMCDGRVVLDVPGSFYPSPPAKISIAANLIGASTCGVAFSGILNEAGPAGVDTISRLLNRTSYTVEQALTLDGREHPGPVRLRIKFNSNRAGYFEPIAVTGKTGAGDVLFVHYEGGNRLRFGLDHWGYGGQSTGPLEVDPKSLHELVISLGSLLPPLVPDEPDRFAKLRNRCLVILDGHVLLDFPSEFFSSTPEQIRICSNPIGGSSADPAFSGEMKEAGRIPLAELKQLLP